jgi:hypothetical protein
MLREQVGQDLQHVSGSDVAIHSNGETFPRERVDHRQHPKGFAVMRASLDEVIRPDMVPPARTQPDTRPIVQPQSPPLGLSPRNFQPLTPPDAFHTLVFHMPAIRSQQGRHPTIAISAVLAGQLNDRRRQRRLVVP